MGRLTDHGEERERERGRRKLESREGSALKWSVRQRGNVVKNRGGGDWKKGQALVRSCVEKRSKGEISLKASQKRSRRCAERK